MKLEGISDADYHDDPCTEPSLSSSIARIIVAESPLHAWRAHPRLGGIKRAATAEMGRGDVLHAMLLGGGPPVITYDAKDWKTKIAQVFRKEHRAQGYVVLLKRELDAYQEAALNISDRLKTLGYDVHAYHEATERFLTWHETADDGTQVQCRGKIDVWAEPEIWDLKFVENANPKKIPAKFETYGYHIQGHAYESGVSIVAPDLAGRVRTTFLFCEMHSPFEVVPAASDGMFQRLAELQWRRAVNTWAHCMRANHWPGYVSSREPIRVTAKPWLLADEEAEFGDD